MVFLNFILEILQTPAVMVALMALVGLLVQRASFSDVLKGTLKTAMGFVIMTLGAQAIVSSLDKFSFLFSHGFNVEGGIVPNNEAIVSIAQSSYGSEMALIMLFAFVVNILLARFTPLKYIFLTGHHTMFMSMLVAVILSSGGVTGIPMIIIGSLIVGSLMVIMPAIIQGYTQKVTGTPDLAMGHFSTLSYLVAGFVGEKLGNKKYSTEDIKVPSFLLFLRDTPVAIALTMLFFFLLSSLMAGDEIVSQLSGGDNWFIFSLMQALMFAGGVYIVLQGVKMIISEIIPAFKGISEKIVKGAKPALDCPMVFPYAPNAVLIGFLSSFSAGICVMILQMSLGWMVVIPSVVPHFFLGATSGVYGNATGGRRGAILGAFTQGLLISFLPVLLLGVMGSLGLAKTTFSDLDFIVVGLLLGFIMKN